jgi:hypothetical protein
VVPPTAGRDRISAQRAQRGRDVVGDGLENGGAGACRRGTRRKDSKGLPKCGEQRQGDREDPVLQGR